jgi:hypothetical protein
MGERVRRSPRSFKPIDKISPVVIFLTTLSPSHRGISGCDSYPRQAFPSGRDSVRGHRLTIEFMYRKEKTHGRNA